MPLLLTTWEKPKAMRSNRAFRLNGTSLRVSFASFRRYTSSRLLSRCTTCRHTILMLFRCVFLRFFSLVSTASSALPLITFRGARMSWEIVRMIFFRISNSAMFCSIVSSRCFLFFALTLISRCMTRYEMNNRMIENIIKPVMTKVECS